MNDDEETPPECIACGGEHEWDYCVECGCSICETCADDNVCHDCAEAGE